MLRHSFTACIVPFRLSYVRLLSLIYLALSLFYLPFSKSLLGAEFKAVDTNDMAKGPSL